MPTIRPYEGPPRIFAYKSTWLAVTAENNAEVAELLATRGLGAVEVSAPLRGWVFVVGGGLTRENSGKALFEEVKGLLESVSARFGSARYFTTHRGVNLNGWARADGGVLARFYWSCLETAEREFEWGDMAREEEPHLARDESGWRFVREDAVMDLADRWSISPTEFAEVDFAKLWEGGLVLDEVLPPPTPRPKKRAKPTTRSAKKRPSTKKRPTAKKRPPAKKRPSAKKRPKAKARPKAKKRGRAPRRR
ncbi:MAG TPA: hypothetical protein VN903_05475 [Polyangia bacterium]|jgi:hypothetical protein|nr:hypothetical protein [Polyangia bacterium]